MRLLLILTLPLTAWAAALGPAAIRTVYGAEYADAGRLLLVLLAPFPLVPLMNVSGAVSVGLGRLRLPLISLAIGAAVNLGLAFLLIPRHDAIGAAVANSGAQVVAGLILIVYVGRAVGHVDWEARFLVRAVAAAAIGGAAAWAPVQLIGNGPGLLLGIISGVLAYAAVAALLRILPPADASWLRETGDARFGRRIRRLADLWAGRQ